MKLIYPAVFHKEDGAYWVEFPDLEGCQSFGGTINETLENAKEALEAYCITLIEDGKKLNPASDISKIKSGQNEFTSLVETDISAYLSKSKAVKKTLTVPAWLNDMAVKRGVNFSQVLQNALFEQLNVG